MDIPSGEWFFTFSDVIITSYNKEKLHINSKELYKNKKILYTENKWEEDKESKIIGVYTDFFKNNINRFNLFKSAKIFLVHNSAIVIDEISTVNWLNNNINIILYSQNLTFSHPRAFSLPLGQANSMWPHGDKNFWKKDTPEKDINILLTYCENTSHLRDQIKNLKSFYISKIPKCNYETYVSYLQRSKFVICPPGAGPDTHRLWETLAAGAIPIVIEDKFIRQLIRTFPEIPLIIIKNYNDLDYSKLEYKSIKNLEILNKNYWVEKFKDFLLL